MATASQENFVSASSFPEKFDVLPRLVDGIDFLTASYWNHLISGAQKMTSAIGGTPLDFNGVTWPGGTNNIDDALSHLSRIDAGTLTLYPAAQGFEGEIVFAPGRFTRTSGSGSNANVPFFTGVSIYQDIPEGADDGQVKAFLSGEFEVVYRYDTSSPYLVTGCKVKTNRASSDENTEMGVAWFAIESEIG